MNLEPGAEVEVFIDGGDLEPYRIAPASVLYQDKYVFALNKPAGIPIQPTPARYKGTVYEAMLHLLHNPYQRHTKPELAMVQRLDRDTSGVVVFSIHKRSHKALTATFTERKVNKVYLALVAGRPEKSNGSIHTMLGRHRASGRMKSVQKGGKEAITHYRVVEQSDTCALLEVDILTGRTHQIRVHLSEAGFPIVGDTLYGGPATHNGFSVERSMLHAHTLEFSHPCEADKSLHLCAPVPSDFNLTLSRAGLSYAPIP
ncbi:MAG: RluA family pseudouridine synthase [Geobacteraceae bacterium]|nr:RluA family pseudouridine synthase [Geobacteraceae bacterium]